jgi:hypothetical protein
MYGTYEERSLMEKVLKAKAIKNNMALTGAIAALILAITLMLIVPFAVGPVSGMLTDKSATAINSLTYDDGTPSAPTPPIVPLPPPIVPGPPPPLGP